MSSRNTVMSMSSENREISPYASDNEVPPLKRKRGWPAGRPLNSTSSVHATQKSFSTFCSGVPSRVAAPRNTSRRSSGAAPRNSEKTAIHHDRRLVERFSGPGIAFLVGLEKPPWERSHSSDPHPEEVRSPSRASILVMHRDRSEERRDSPLLVLGRPEFS